MKISTLPLAVALAFLLATGASARLSGDAVPNVDFNLSAAQINKQCTAARRQADLDVAAVLRVPDAQRTFANTVGAVELAQAELARKTSPLIFMKDVSPDPAVREAGLACNNAVAKLAIRLGARPDLYRAYRTVARNTRRLGEPEAKLLELYLSSSERAGAGLQPQVRAEVVRLREQLSKLEDDFNNALVNNTDTVELSRAELAGLPDDFINRLKRTPAGNYLVQTKASDYIPVMENAIDANARRKVETAYQSRGGQQNVERLEKAIALRHRIARSFGYPNWSAYVLADQMAGSPKRVEAFLNDLQQRLAAKTRAELDVLLALKRKDEPTATRIEGWDWRYYANQLKKTRYAVDNEQVREYFPVNHVIDQVFGLYQQILGVRFEEIKPAEAWTTDVRLFAVRDAQDNRLLSFFYTDLFPRDGKYNHFAAFDLNLRRESEGKLVRPVAAMVGNWPRGSADRPALMSHSEVETLFHEFGHIMHQTLTTARYATIAGANVRRDFVEAPSQMLENWVWDRGILKQLSRHYRTGEALPDALIDRMIAAKHVNEGIYTSRQLLFATVDFRYHTAGPKVDTTALWNATIPLTAQVPTIPGTLPQAGFGHLMGGYDSRYYGYLWSKVFAQDMFTRFEKEGLASAAVGTAYRRNILEPGGTREPDSLLKAFLGRDPNPEAFYRDLGL